MTPVNPYDRVRLITDRYRSSGAPIDTIGYVLEVYLDGGLEVEVSDPASGVTRALLSVRPEDVEPADELLVRLMASVRALAANPTVQLESLASMGPGAGGDELTIEFDRLFRPAVALLSSSPRDRAYMLRLADLDDWLASLRNRSDPSLWTAEAIARSDEWTKLRELASAVLLERGD
ncbi:hypothetical protein [Leifsonia aquatica]|jgi:hypothetical protein|uniref:Uncharacterized protein n=1 Tax=Leifsonia aquatica TaxID=144185 RepID=A0A7W4UYY0_LEIAQ|nr:hypothetical protein [Leifsonia aquatica]MBB2968522.1 hypothetical protein [Leifsonia aquatica]